FLKNLKRPIPLFLLYITAIFTQEYKIKRPISYYLRQDMNGSLFSRGIILFKNLRLKSCKCHFIYRQRIRLFTRRPEMGATWVLYSLPFGTDIWICLPIFVTVSGFFLWGLNALAIKYNCPHRKYSLGAAFWQIFAGLLQQSMLVSILTTMQPTLPFSNFEDLRKLPDWQLGTVTNSALTDLLQFSPEGSAMRDAWENKVIKYPKTSLVTENRQGMKNILSIHKYAYLGGMGKHRISPSTNASGEGNVHRQYWI
ncbi:hypothetical protein Anas_14446, partial [Armadillidium nasatum]